MHRMRMVGVLTAAVLVGSALAAAPRYLESLETKTDPVELLQRRIDVLEIQLQELSARVGTAELSEPLVSGDLCAPGGRLAGK